MFEGSSGNVGIGTGDGATLNARLEVADSSNTTYLIAGGDDSSNGRGLTFTSSASANFNGAVHTIRAPSSQGEIAFSTYNTERMRINSLGSVGIGTTLPTTNAHPQLFLGAGSFLLGGATGIGALDIGNNLYYNGGWKYRATGAATLLDFSSSGKLVFYTAPSGSANAAATITTRFMVNNSGKVGIGTASPLDHLHINDDSGDARILLDGHTNFDAELKFAEAGVVKYTVGHDAATDSFVIGTTNVDTQKRLVVDSAGDVSIEKGNLLLAGATSSINPTLSMSDDAGFGTAGAKLWYGNSDGFSYYDSYWTGGGGHKFRSQLAGTTVNNMILHRDGDLGFGTLNPASFGDGNIEFKDTRGGQLGMRITSSATSAELGVDTYGTYIQGVTTNRGFRVYTSDSSAADTLALQITPQGLVQQPKLYDSNGFFWVRNPNQSGQSATTGVIFGTRQQAGSGNYSTSTGRYTTPVDGVYQFNAQVRIDSADASSSGHYMRMAFYTGTSPNAIQTGMSQGHVIHGPGMISGNYFSMSSSWAAYLSAGTQVGVAVLANTGTYDIHGESAFSGYLIG